MPARTDRTRLEGVFFDQQSGLGVLQIAEAPLGRNGCQRLFSLIELPLGFGKTGQQPVATGQAQAAVELQVQVAGGIAPCTLLRAVLEPLEAADHVVIAQIEHGQEHLTESEPPGPILPGGRVLASFGNLQLEPSEVFLRGLEFPLAKLAADF